VLIAQGPAEQTGKVIDYPSHKVGDQIKSGMDWVQSADARSASEKLQDFLGALGKNGTNPESHKQYIQGELDKLIGIGEGLHISKEQTKGAAAAGWKALNDGTVADFLARPNAINEPMFKVVSNALDALSKDPETTNKALAALGTAIAESSEHYSALPHREQGHVIGHTMFNLFNPEGSTEAAEAGFKIASNVATQVDKAVVQAVGQQIRAIEEIAKTAPEHAAQAKEMLYEYLKGKGLTGPQLEYAGVPKGYFDNIDGKLKGAEIAKPSEVSIGDYTAKQAPYFEFGKKIPLKDGSKVAADATGIPEDHLQNLLKQDPDALERLTGGKLIYMEKRYRDVYLQAHPQYAGSNQPPFDVHHRIPQDVITRHPDWFSHKEIHDASNLVGIPDSTGAHKLINREWTKFWPCHPNATKQDVLDFANAIDKKYGASYLP
jgi:hypothetical protein